MPTTSKERTSKRNQSWIQWIVGIPVSLLVLGLFIFLVQPWGEPRESITSTAPKDGDFYNPSTDQTIADSSDAATLEAPSESTDEQVPNNLSQIVDVNLASWKPVDESSVAEEQLPSQSDEVEGGVLVEISSALRTKAAGDRVQFTIPQREDVLVGEVTKVEVAIANTRILTGTLRDGSREYAFEITLKESSTAAQIDTFNGRYELSGTHRYGWLKASSKTASDADQVTPDPDQPQPDPGSNDGELESESPRPGDD